MFSDLNGNGKVDAMAGPANEILQEGHYYPFGLEMTGPWSESDNPDVFDNRFNGKERMQRYGLNYHDFGARWYDAEISRWLSVDPLSDHPNQVDKSTYNAFWNSPIVYNDLDGKCPWCPKGKEAIEIYAQGAIVQNDKGAWMHNRGEWVNLNVDLPNPDPATVDNTNVVSNSVNENTQLSIRDEMMDALRFTQKTLDVANLPYENTRVKGLGIGLTVLSGLDHFMKEEYELAALDALSLAVGTELMIGELTFSALDSKQMTKDIAREAKRQMAYAGLMLKKTGMDNSVWRRQYDMAAKNYRSAMSRLERDN